VGGALAKGFPSERHGTEGADAGSDR
jgi:hypothetical protein